MLNYDPVASGILTSGSTIANFISLTVARNIKAGYNIIKQGVRASDKEILFYGSTEVHSSIDRAIQLLGLGLISLKKIPVNNKFEIRVNKLRETIESDIKTGYKPICIIDNAGTVNTGAVENLNALVDMAKEFDMWFHVDGAFGAWCKLSPQSRHLVDGVERANSIAFDFHKWMYINYELGCVLIRNRNDHYYASNLSADYIIPPNQRYW